MLTLCQFQIAIYRAVAGKSSPPQLCSTQRGKKKKTTHERRKRQKNPTKTKPTKPKTPHYINKQAELWHCHHLLWDIPGAEAFVVLTLQLTISVTGCWTFPHFLPSRMETNYGFCHICSKRGKYWGVAEPLEKATTASPLNYTNGNTAIFQNCQRFWKRDGPCLGLKKSSRTERDGCFMGIKYLTKVR